MKDQTIRQASDSYEAWLQTYTPLNAADLKTKHAMLADAAFPFLRGTFFRWMQLWPGLCPDLAIGPKVSAVGDLHVENFGTWRDAEGRLVWGVNDFDEAFTLPYANDLVRLATSALLAIDGEHLSVDRKGACEAILTGYTERLQSGGKPFVIDEENGWFIDVLRAKTADPVVYWQKFRDKVEEATKASNHIPPPAAAALSEALPRGAVDVRMVPRCAGVGSLGKPRFVALAQWLGGPIVREIKALAPSAVVWAQGGKKASSQITKLVELTVANGVRCPDPFFHVGEHWVQRRLAPDSHKIELKASTKTGHGEQLLEAMGRETANIHLGSPAATGAIIADLKAQSGKWLSTAAKVMQEATVNDQREWARTARG
jgi:uncharacterized protein (DUF2252 family)